VYSCG